MKTKRLFPNVRWLSVAVVILLVSLLTPTHWARAEDGDDLFATIGTAYKMKVRIKRTAAGEKNLTISIFKRKMSGTGIFDLVPVDSSEITFDPSLKVPAGTNHAPFFFTPMALGGESILIVVSDPEGTAVGYSAVGVVGAKFLEEGEGTEPRKDDGTKGPVSTPIGVGRK